PEARGLGDSAPAQRAAYVGASAARLGEHAPAALVFANHVLLGAPVGAASGVRFRVKAHGSELEYAMRGNEELSRWGAETLAGAEVVYAGSEHIRDVLEEVVGPLDRVEIVPPGVDVDEFRPEPREEALRMVAGEAAAAGVLPVVSGHSGLAEVAAGIGEEMGPEESALLTFPAGDAVALRERLAAILALPAERRRELGLAARRAVERRWSWQVVAAALLVDASSA